MELSLRPDNDLFLHVILSQLSVLRAQQPVLTKPNVSPERQIVAAHACIQALCSSLKAFEAVGLGELKRSLAKPKHLRKLHDKQWLFSFATDLERALRAHKGGHLVWPPPQDPRALSNELLSLYDGVLASSRVIKPLSSNDLRAIVEPIRHKACDLQKQTSEESVRLAVARDPSSVSNPSRKSRIERLVGGTGLLALFGVVSIPATVMQAPDATYDLARAVTSAASYAFWEIADIATDMRQDLGIDPPGKVVPWIRQEGIGLQGSSGRNF